MRADCTQYKTVYLFFRLGMVLREQLKGGEGKTAVFYPIRVASCADCESDGVMGNGRFS